MKKAEHGRGSVKAIRKSDGTIGYQALLPRALSTPPPGCKNPKLYQEPVGPRYGRRADAETLLAAALSEVRERDAKRLQCGLTLSHYVDAEIQGRHHAARRKYGSETRANRHVSTWRSIRRVWLADRDFMLLPPQAVDASEDLQPFLDYLRDEAEGRSGDPLSGNFIRNVFALVRAAFDRVPRLGINPAAALKMPPKNEPLVRYLELAAQRRLFGAPADVVPLRDRVMVGCGTGAGLRIGELLSLEARDVHLDAADPHLMVRYGGPGHAPTKGERIRRVELVEPGLGFWRLFMAELYRPGDTLVFAGPQGGYQKAWPERFPGWAPLAGVERLSSHIMRHTYAVAVLSGSWGYEPKSLEFVSSQLGHADLITTQRYYAAFEQGTWAREARAMRGAGTVERLRGPVTALELLGIEVGSEVARPKSAAGMASGVRSPSLTQSPETKEKTRETEVSGPQDLVAAWDAAVGAVANGEPTAVARLLSAGSALCREVEASAPGVRARGAAS